MYILYGTIHLGCGILIRFRRCGIVRVTPADSKDALCYIFFWCCTLLFVALGVPHACGTLFHTLVIGVTSSK